MVICTPSTWAIGTGNLADPLRDPRPRLLRQRRRRHRRLPGPDRQARLPAGPGRHRHLAAAVLSLALRRTTATTSPTTRASIRPTARSSDFKRLPARGPPRAGCGSSPSWSSTTPRTSIPGSSAPAAPRRAAGSATSTSGATRRRSTRTPASSSRTSRRSNWTWDPVAKAYYWHRFYSHQPDLNFDNPRGPRAPCSRSLDFWLDMGVDGLRLDAVPYLYEREGTNCENLPRDARLPEGAARARRREVPEPHAAGRGQPVAGGRGRLLRRAATSATWRSTSRSCRGCSWRIRMEDRFPIVDILQQTPPIPDDCQWATVPAQPRRADAGDGDRRGARLHVPGLRHATRRRASTSGIRRRLAPLLGNDRRRIELMNGLLFSLPGTPVLYYGDEIGMGDNIYLGDRNGVRTPMQWSADRNAGFSRANPQKLYLPVITDPEYHYEAVNVEAQQSNPHSLLWWTKRLIALRKRHQAFGRGTLEFLHPENHQVLAFLRRYRGRVPAGRREPVALRPARGAGPLRVPRARRPWSCSAATRSPDRRPAVPADPGAALLLLVLPGDGARDDPPAPGDVGAEAEIPVLAIPGGWESCLEGRCRTDLETALARLLPTRRWFGGKARTIRQLEITESIALDLGARLALIAVEYTEGEPETYALPLAFAWGDRAGQVLRDWRPAVLARLQSDGPGGTGVLYDATWDTGFGRGLLEAIARRRRFKGSGGELAGSPAAAFREPARRGRPSRPSSGQSRATRRCGSGTGSCSRSSGGWRRGSTPTWRSGASSPSAPTSATRLRSPAGWRSGTPAMAVSRAPWASCTGSSPTRATPGPTRSTSWAATSSA